MRVGYVAPTSIAAVNGGVRTQAFNTIEQIRHFDVEPILISPWNHLEKEEADLVHIFASTVENVGIADSIKSLGIPMVLSPVFYTNHSPSFIKNVLKIEKFSSFFGSGIRSDFNVKAHLCNQADLLLPNTGEEAKLIEHGFSIPGSKIQVVSNGVEERFAHADPSLFIDTYGLQDFVLFVGQAGAPRKNILTLLKAAPEIDAPIVIIGSFYDNDYGNRCKNIAQNIATVHLIDTLEHDSELLASAYAASKVFILPSLYETPGVAALEAGLAGANIVITQNGGTKDYFGSHVEFIDPDSTDSILKAVYFALQKEKSNVLKQHILDNFTWKEVARQTANLYKELIS